MEITIKNLKVAEFASEETLCFEATVYVDGVRSFTAKNDGHGGCNFYHPVKGATRDGEMAVINYAKTLPAVKTKIKDKDDPTGFWHMDVSIDSLVDDAIQVVQDEKVEAYKTHA